MINIIYKILTANEHDGHQDNNNDNVTNYLESHKGKTLHLAEKHYENLVEAMTYNAISSAAATSSTNPTSSLLSQSSSTFSRPSNQSNTYSRIEEQGSFHNSEDDIAD